MGDQVHHEILVVEDEPLLRELTVEGLVECGFIAFEAANGDEALNVLECHPEVEAVVSDVHMPGRLDGIELAGIIRCRWPGMLVIVTSGLRWIRNCPLPRGASFLRKPYGIGELVALVRSRLAARAEADVVRETVG